MKIGIIGAIDRYNYGDVLFPLVAREALGNRLPDAKFDFFGAIESDLSRFDALPTKPMSEISHSGVDAIIVVGGETLIATWTATYINTSTSPVKVLCARIFRKVVGHRRIEQMIQNHFRAKNALPWSFRKEDYNSRKVIYNAVGGASFERLTQIERDTLKANLLDADYISVRDPLSMANIESLGIASSSVNLSPDSAFIMSDIYPIETIKKTTHDKLPGGRYMAFQIGITYVKGNEQVIVRQLREVVEGTGLSILLVPIGRVPMHEDDKALGRIIRLYEKLYGKNNEIHYLEQPSIFETMSAIAQSSIFVGTSLHGNITALSYGTPSVSIGKIDKLAGFLRQYSVPDQQVNIDYKKIADAVKKSLLISSDALQKNGEVIKKSIYENFDRIADAIRE